MTQATPEAAKDSSYLWVVFAACAGVVAVAYNTTAVMTALPAMKSSLDLDVDTTQWVVGLYMLGAATSLAALGHFADMFGLVRIFFVGLAAFAIGAVANALADDAVLVLAGRAFQGIGAGGLMATAGVRPEICLSATIKPTLAAIAEMPRLMRMVSRLASNVRNGSL